MDAGSFAISQIPKPNEISGGCCDANRRKYKDCKSANQYQNIRHHSHHATMTEPTQHQNAAWPCASIQSTAVA
jgi:hypothetical protein